MSAAELSRSGADPTRQRLLEAAEAIFAEAGFEAASVRDICKRAGANVAAVNYHFGDKKRLYIEAVKYAHRLCHDGVPFPEWEPGTPPEKRLREFIRVMVQRMFQDPHPASLQLLMREMAQPTEACAEWVREYIRPIADRLLGILVDLLPEHTPEQRFLFGFSIVGQCLHYKQNRPVVRLLMGEERFARLDAEALARHISDFSLAGIAAGRQGGPS
jgi:AcrR family transcriptional regulator